MANKTTEASGKLKRQSTSKTPAITQVQKEQYYQQIAPEKSFLEGQTSYKITVKTGGSIEENFTMLFGDLHKKIRIESCSSR